MSLFSSSKIVLFLFLLICLSEYSCLNNSPLDIDVSRISIPLKIYRFEKDLFSIDSSLKKEDYKVLEQKYPEFYPVFVEKIAELGPYPNDYLERLKEFLRNKDLRKLHKDCDSAYSDLNSFEPELKLAFQHFKYYYPHHSIPQILTFVSGFNSAIVNTDSTLGIGLDMFMGSHYPIYRSIQFPKYLTRTLIPAYIPVTAMKGYAKQIFPEKKGSPRLLDEMVYEGKILYFLDAMFPKTADSVKISYTTSQMAWCKTHENDIWSSLLEGDRLFKGDKNDLDTYFSEGPFTPGLSQESAPRLGMWMGWQIVRKYMSEQPKTTLNQLMDENDGEKVLRLSHYRP